jgi:hypothetical protein
MRRKQQGMTVSGWRCSKSGSRWRLTAARVEGNEKLEWWIER